MALKIKTREEAIAVLRDMVRRKKEKSTTTPPITLFKP